MVACTITVMISLGAFTALSKSYEMIAHARIRDNARVILKTYGDQFLRLQTTERAPSGVTYTRWLFNITPGPTSQGLRWGELSDDPTSTVMSTEPLTVQLRGNGDNTTPAVVTRNVVYVNPVTGETSTTSRFTRAAGYYLQAEFTVTYTFNGRPRSESLTFLRAVP